MAKSTVSGKFPSYKEISVDSLIPYARNSRTHSDEQVGQIAASIKEFGFTNPVLTDGDNGIIAGHGRVMAAKKLGMDTVPVIELSHLTDAQRRAYIIADNKLALNAGWDFEVLKVELSDLGSMDFDLDLTGFDSDEISSLFDEDTDSKDYPQSEEYREVYEVVVTCRDEAEQESIYAMMTAKGLKCRVLSM